MRNAVLFSLVSSLCAVAVISCGGGSHRPAEPLVIAHRGASGYLPEHTIEAYEMAHHMGADFIEVDVVMTRDGIPIARHDLYLEGTTNAAEVFPGRHRPDGRWHAADFTLAEIRQLTARTPGSPAQSDPEGRFRVPTLEGILQSLRRMNSDSGCAVGIYLEIKHPAYHAEIGLPLEEEILSLLTAYGYTGRRAHVYIQSFEPDSLRTIRSALGSRLPLVQLIDSSPAHAYMRSEAGIDEIATYANAIGPNKRLIEDATGGAVEDGQLVRLAHARGLKVHAWTFSADRTPDSYESLPEELRQFTGRYDVDGVIVDHPDIAVAALKPRQASTGPEPRRCR